MPGGKSYNDDVGAAELDRRRPVLITAARVGARLPTRALIMVIGVWPVRPQAQLLLLFHGFWTGSVCPDNLDTGKRVRPLTRCSMFH